MTTQKTTKKGHSLGSRYEKLARPDASRVFTGLERTGQMALAEWDHQTEQWYIWLAYDSTRALGSFLVLGHDGGIIRVDRRATHTERTVVTPPFGRAGRKKAAKPPT